MLMAFIIAVVVGLVVKLGLGLFAQTAKYADVAGVIVGLLVFLSRSGLAL